MSHRQQATNLQPLQQGLVQVYTGNGKGKSTAAWGQALRAIGHGWRVAFVEFLKPVDTGERAAAEHSLPGVRVFGGSSPYDPQVDQRESERLREESRRNFATALDVLRSGEWDMVVLDEINMALHYEYISREEMLQLLDACPTHMEIILTGRYAPSWLIGAADLVTEMVEVKHPAKCGLKAREGIEH